MTTRIGFFIFAGVVIGALAGHWLASSAGPGVLAGGLLGIILGGVLDYRDWRKGSGTDGSGTDHSGTDGTGNTD